MKVIFICISRVLFIYEIYFYIFNIATYMHMFSFLVIVSFLTIIGESVNLIFILYIPMNFLIVS